MKLELRKGYDSEYAEAIGRVSKTKPVMGVLIGNNNVLDVAQGTMKEIIKYFQSHKIDEVINLL